MRRHVLFALFLSFFAAFAGAQTLPLNTGYDHAAFAPYLPAPVADPSTVQDRYWVNIASYPQTAPPAPAASWALITPNGWAQPLPQSYWNSARNTYVSAAGVNVTNPGYTIFRKCFCLLPNYKNPSIAFRVRADDNIEIWLNTVLNKVLNQTPGNYSPSSTPLTSLPSQASWFRTGKNCLYVLVEDTGGATSGGFTGFNLSGNVTATAGLLPFVLTSDQTEIPCCKQATHPAGAPTTARTAADDEQATIKAIVDLAEKRRASRAQRK